MQRLLYTCIMKKNSILFLFSSSLLLLLSSCQSDSKQSNPIEVQTEFELTLDSFSLFVQETDKQVAPANYDKLTPDVLQALLNTFHDSSDIFSQKLTRHWQRQFKNQDTTGSNTFFKEWLQMELLRFDVEERILGAWKSLENVEIASAMQALPENENKRRMELIANQLRSDSLFIEVVNNLRAQKAEIENNPKLILP